MVFPMPTALADDPGGGIVTASRGINALTQSDLENKIKSVEAQYAPLTKQSEAASKLAYANLMGPQFLAKLMGHPEILANMTEEQRNNALNTTYAAGTGQGFGSNLFPLNVPKEQSMYDLLKNKLINLFGNGNTTQNNIPSSQNAIMQNPIFNQKDKNAISNLKPVQYYKIPETQQQVPIEIPNREKNWFERTAEAQGIESEGKEAGTLRARDIQELNANAFNANTMQSTLNELSGIVNSPEFREIRQIPIAGQHEIGWYARYGTPEQKELIGRFLSEQGNIVVNAASQFKGAFRVGEQSLINTMKVNPSDMPDVAKGKIDAMSFMNQMLSKRSSLTAQLMEDHHLSKGKAMEIADKQINGDSIRKQLGDIMIVTIKNKKTGQRINIPLNEAKKMGIKMKEENNV